jgi:hypothetical protein
MREWQRASHYRFSIGLCQIVSGTRLSWFHVSLFRNRSESLLDTDEHGVMVRCLSV